MPRHPIRQRVGRELIKALLNPLLRWKPQQSTEPGFSIVLGVPWDLRHLLKVNLQFVAKTDISELHTLYVVFDRRRKPEMASIAEAIAQEFPELPIQFINYPALAGGIVETVHVSTFYNSMNTTLALGQCKTQYAVLHDFDLYPLCADHFTSIVDAMRQNSWRFCGHELTHFDGLTDDDRQIGTWTLGVDCEWLRRNYRPIDCFHRVTRHNSWIYNLDPFAWIQFQTPARGLVPQGGTPRYCHVKNLCSTYLRFIKGAALAVAWRLHYLWYLQSLAGRDRLAEITSLMQGADRAILNVDQYHADFSTVHVTCANVLESELGQMERALFGATRTHVQDYIAAFRSFLLTYGDTTPLPASRPSA